MYVISKKIGDEFYFLSEVYFGSDLCPHFPQIIVKTQWLWADPNCLDCPYVSDYLYFENKTDAYSLFIALDLLGDETILYEIRYVEVSADHPENVAPREEVPGNE